LVARRISEDGQLFGGEKRFRPERTLSEKIADDLGAAIARGEYAEGDRLLEQELSAYYRVSRGPVREALRILAQWDMVVLTPRRGAFVVGVGLDSVVDLFNIRAVVMGLAARYFAHMAAEEDRADLKAALAELDAVSRQDVSTKEFQRCTTQVGVRIADGCGSDALSRVIAHQNRSSAWSTLWQSYRLDFITRERRLEATADYLAMGRAIEQRDGEQAEAVMRKMLMVSRENAMAALTATSGESYDLRRLLQA
jgi:DNA-binding GntR family transcriptional regulator